MENAISSSTRNYFGKTISIPRRFRNGTKGIVRNLSFPEWDKNDFFTLNFRLEVCDSSGNILGYLPIILRYHKKSGGLSEGDEIIVKGKKNRRGHLTPSSVYNLTTMSVVITSKNNTVGGFFGYVLGILILGILSLACFIFFFVGIYMAVAEGDPNGGIVAVFCIIGSSVFGMLAKKLMNNH